MPNYENQWCSLTKLVVPRSKIAARPRIGKQQPKHWSSQQIDLACCTAVNTVHSLQNVYSIQWRCRQSCDQMVHYPHKQHTYTHTKALACRQTQNGYVLISLPVRDQETSILHGEFVKMFQITKLISPVFHSWGKKLRSGTLHVHIYTKC